MAYDPTLSTDVDKVRLLIGDTGATQLFPDTTISAMLTLAGGSVYLTAAALCDALAAQYAGKVDIVVDGLSVSQSQKSEAYAARAAQLRRDALALGTGATGAPIVTGVSIGEMDGVTANTDRPGDAFSFGDMDNPAAGSAYSRPAR